MTGELFVSLLIGGWWGILIGILVVAPFIIIVGTIMSWLDRH